MQTIAAQVFDLPVIVPAPQEYVALGAAAQAAWALTGERPAWGAGEADAVSETPVPGIREQYIARLP